VGTELTAHILVLFYGEAKAGQHLWLVMVSSPVCLSAEMLTTRNEICSLLSLVSPGQISGMHLKLVHGHFLPYHIQFIT
jgi:hypothetical protein